MLAVHLLAAGHEVDRAVGEDAVVVKDERFNPGEALLEVEGVVSMVGEDAVGQQGVKFAQVRIGGGKEVLLSQ